MKENKILKPHLLYEMPQRALTATFRCLAVCLTRTINLLDLKSDSASIYDS